MPGTCLPWLPRTFFPWPVIASARDGGEALFGGGCVLRGRMLRGGFHNYLRLICLDQRSLAAAAHICAGRQGQPYWISDFCTSSPRSSMPVIGQQIAALATRRPRRSAW